LLQLKLRRRLVNGSWLPGALIFVFHLGLPSLAVEDASCGLSQLVEFALLAVRIQIRKENRVVELRPAFEPTAL
jgi:hypothetical protein